MFVYTVIIGIPGPLKGVEVSVAHSDLEIEAMRRRSGKRTSLWPALLIEGAAGSPAEVDAETTRRIHETAETLPMVSVADVVFIALRRALWTTSATKAYSPDEVSKFIVKTLSDAVVLGLGEAATASSGAGTSWAEAVYGEPGAFDCVVPPALHGVVPIVYGVNNAADGSDSEGVTYLPVSSTFVIASWNELAASLKSTQSLLKTISHQSVRRERAGASRFHGFNLLDGRVGNNADGTPSRQLFSGSNDALPNKRARADGDAAAADANGGGASGPAGAASSATGEGDAAARTPGPELVNGVPIPRPIAADAVTPAMIVTTFEHFKRSNSISEIPTELLCCQSGRLPTVPARLRCCGVLICLAAVFPDHLAKLHTAAATWEPGRMVRLPPATCPKCGETSIDITSDAVPTPTVERRVREFVARATYQREVEEAFHAVELTKRTRQAELAAQGRGPMSGPQRLHPQLGRPDPLAAMRRTATSQQQFAMYGGMRSQMMAPIVINTPMMGAMNPFIPGPQPMTAMMNMSAAQQFAMMQRMQMQQQQQQQQQQQAMLAMATMTYQQHQPLQQHIGHTNNQVGILQQQQQQYQQPLYSVMQQQPIYPTGANVVPTSQPAQQADNDAQQQQSRQGGFRLLNSAVASAKKST